MTAIDYLQINGYKVVKAPYASGSTSEVTFSSMSRIIIHPACMKVLGNPPFLVLYLNPDTKHLIIAGVEDDHEPGSFSISHRKRSRAGALDLAHKPFCRQLYDIMGWDKEYRFLVRPEIMHEGDKTLLNLDLTKAIILPKLVRTFSSKGNPTSMTVHPSEI